MLNLIYILFHINNKANNNFQLKEVDCKHVMLNLMLNLIYILFNINNKSTGSFLELSTERS